MTRPAEDYEAAYSPKGGATVHALAGTDVALCGLRGVVSMDEPFRVNASACRRCCRGIELLRPAESPVHPLPPAPRDPFPCSCTEEQLCEEHHALMLHDFACSTPPPVRVVRLRGDHPAVRGPWAMAQAVEAAAIGATTVEYITHGGNGYPPAVARELAAIAARHARLALGVS